MIAMRHILGKDVKGNFAEITGYFFMGVFMGVDKY